MIRGPETGRAGPRFRAALTGGQTLERVRPTSVGSSVHEAQSLLSRTLGPPRRSITQRSCRADRRDSFATAIQRGARLPQKPAGNRRGSLFAARALTFLVWRGCASLLRARRSGVKRKDAAKRGRRCATSCATACASRGQPMRAATFFSTATSAGGKRDGSRSPRSPHLNAATSSARGAGESAVRVAS